MASPLAVSDIVVVPEFIDSRLARMLHTMLVLRGHRGEGKRDDHMPEALSFWGDSTLDAFHLAVLGQVERVANGPLFPTYCYARLYSRGDTLLRHHDREACEIVVSIHLGSRGGEPPPLCFANGDQVHQQPGDAVVFPGARVDHWRATFVGEQFGQVFMNFVRADGQFADQALDQRFTAFPSGVVPHRDLIAHLP